MVPDWLNTECFTTFDVLTDSDASQSHDINQPTAHQNAREPLFFFFFFLVCFFLQSIFFSFTVKKPHNYFPLAQSVSCVIAVNLREKHD